MSLFSFTHFIRDSVFTFRNLRGANRFAQKHELWKGIMNYKWLSKMLFVFAIIASIMLINSVMNWWNQMPNQMNSIAELGSIVGTMFKGGYDLFVIGGLKYVVLILVEVVIFHFARRTLEIVRGEEVDNSFSAFIKAQKRMIKVAIFSFLMESFYSIILKVATGVIGFSFIDPVGIFIIQCFFLGYAIIDNYNEIYHMTLKQSFKMTQKYAGVTLVIGIPVYIIMLMPLLGTIFGPILGAIAATITMNELVAKDGGMEWVYAKK
ncbi:MAG: EI24 domain-containing protein [Saprospiraceae bacterium]